MHSSLRLLLILWGSRYDLEKSIFLIWILGGVIDRVVCPLRFFGYSLLLSRSLLSRGKSWTTQIDEVLLNASTSELNWKSNVVEPRVR